MNNQIPRSPHEQLFLDRAMTIVQKYEIDLSNEFFEGDKVRQLWGIMMSIMSEKILSKISRQEIEFILDYTTHSRDIDLTRDNKVTRLFLELKGILQFMETRGIK